MHSFFFAFSGCRIIEIFFFTFLFFILCIAFTFQIHFHIHIFTSEVTCYFCYFCYRLTILLPLNCVPTQPLLRRDVSGAASGRSHRYVVTQFRAHREEVKNIRMQAAIPRDALSDSSNIFLSYTGLLIFCPCVRQQCKM
jgi:hypothetical protein